MRWSACTAITLLLGAAAFGARADAADCPVVSGPPGITEDGRFAVPEPSAEQCEAAAALIERFLGTDPRAFRRAVSLDPMPGNVRISVGRISPWGPPRPVGQIEGDLPGKRHAVTWLTDDLTVVVYQSDDLTGPVTAVLIADHEGYRVCNYPRFPFEGDPRRISVEEIRQALQDGLAAEAEFAACHLDILPIEGGL